MRQKMRKSGAALGQKQIAVKNIVKHLAQANFIKKLGGTMICLTPRGCDFVRTDTIRKK